MSNRIAFIFPAFITEFTGKEVTFLENNGLHINHYLNKISEILSIDLPEFSYQHEIYKEELNSQLVAYSFSCAFNDILKSKQILPDYIAGYSMGIYASLYAGGSITFEDGAKLIYNAYNLVKDLSDQGLYGMGAIVGLTANDIEELISKYSYDLEIININNMHSLVVAGKKEDISNLLNNAKKEGAMSVAELTVNTPYHSKYLNEYLNPFKLYIDTLDFIESNSPIISTYNQKELISIDDLKSELVINLTAKINWYKTMQKLIDNGVDEMYECGAGKDLKKISRFIQGEYKVRSIYKI